MRTLLSATVALFQGRRPLQDVNDAPVQVSQQQQRMLITQVESRQEDGRGERVLTPGHFDSIQQSVFGHLSCFTSG